jgi:hypothetical protein
MNINSDLPRYSNSKVIPRIIRIRGRKFFCHARVISKTVLVGYRSNSSLSIQFLKYYPFKSCEEKSSIPNIQIFLTTVTENAEWNLTFAECNVNWNLAYTDNTWNEIECILIIHGISAWSQKNLAFSDNMLNDTDNTQKEI